MEILEKIRSDSTGKERDRACGEQESILFSLTQPPQKPDSIFYLAGATDVAILAITISPH